jgi:hydroxyacylglutathione hydrolase
VFHVALFQKVFGGDTLFAGGGMGRSDLPFGDGKLLLRSIREQLLTLPAETKVYPGHGPPTTIGREIGHNPSLR